MSRHGARASVRRERNTLFANFEGLHVRTRDDVDRVRRTVEDRVQAIGHKVALIVNYDGFQIDPTVADTYAAMIRYMEMHYYTTASRYTTSAFLRLKLGEALTRRRVHPFFEDTRRGAGLRPCGARRHRSWLTSNVLQHDGEETPTNPCCTQCADCRCLDFTKLQFGSGDLRTLARRSCAYTG